MAKNKKNKNVSRNTTRNGGIPQQNGPYFVIANVEGDIRRKGMATPELCDKYGKTESDVRGLISRAYHCSESKVRDLTRVLENNDARYEQRMATKNRQNVGSAEKANIIVAQKTPKEIQQEIVNRCQTELTDKTKAFEAAVAALREANTRKENAALNLAKAKKEMNDAEDSMLLANSKKHTAENALAECRAIYEAEVAKLKVLDTPKLMHISALADGIPDGKVYMSAYDWEKLSDADKAKVTPITPEDITFSYPADFYQYLDKLGVDGYKSACQFAMSYVELILDTKEGVVEMICKDELVKALAIKQEV